MWEMYSFGRTPYFHLPEVKQFHFMFVTDILDDLTDNVYKSTTIVIRSPSVYIQVE